MQDKNIMNLIGLQDINVLNVENIDQVKYIYIELFKVIPVCPKCNCSKSHIHDYYKQKIKDIPILGMKTILVLNKRRYKCVNCGKRHYEKVPFLGKYQRMTMRLILYISAKLKEQRSLKNICHELKISHTPIYTILKELAVGINELPEVLCIDEFKGNSNGHKYHLSIVDGKNNKILDILETRTKDNIEKYFRKFSKKQRESVRYFITDMYKPYKNLVKLFPNATLIIDKYHYIRQIMWAFENVRKRRQKKMNKDLRIYFKRSKSLLKKPYNSLNSEEKIQVDTMLWYDDEIRQAYNIKENYYSIFLKSKTYDEAKSNLSNWLLRAENTNLKEYKEAVKSHINWRVGILNSFTVRYTNGVTEGFNNKIKVLKRLSYGFRNFENFRKRILLLA